MPESGEALVAQLVRPLPDSFGEAPAGDLLATLRIAMPAHEDADLAALMRRWRDEKPYDPRAGLAG